MNSAGAMQPAVPKRPRIETIDIARGGALLAMAIYHFGWDLEFFGYLDPGTTGHGAWRLFARSIASSFLFLAGVSLVLGHAKGIRWRPFARRLAMIVAAAAGISLVTWFAMGDSFIFFGILHQIALASVIGLAFLRLPGPVVLLAAAFFIAGPHFLRTPLLDHPAFWWIGLSSFIPHSNDYVPVFPWFGAVLAGVGAAKIAQGAGLFDRLGGIEPGGWSRPFVFAGRHSLAVYLVHQPVLIACVWLLAQVAPAQPSGEAFLRACNDRCAETRDNAYCARYCDCALAELEGRERLGDVFSRAHTAETREVMQHVSRFCTEATDAEQSAEPDDD